jgi:hypothetical protein
MEKRLPHTNWRPARVPLSLILFLFYNGPLLEALNLPDLRLSAIGFADDINLLAYGKTTRETYATLETAHEHLSGRQMEEHEGSILVGTSALNT